MVHLKFDCTHFIHFHDDVGRFTTVVPFVPRHIQMRVDLPTHKLFLVVIARAHAIARFVGTTKEQEQATIYRAD